MNEILVEELGLTPQQELFCKLYATNRDYFGNGTQAYIQAYDIDITRKGAYNSARACASELLTKTNILKFIRNLMESTTLNDEFVDRELSFLIEQNSDLSNKLGAIREYNKLKARIQEKLDITSKDKELGAGIFVGDFKND